MYHCQKITANVHHNLKLSLSTISRYTRVYKQNNHFYPNGTHPTFVVIPKIKSFSCTNLKACFFSATLCWWYQVFGKGCNVDCVFLLGKGIHFIPHRRIYLGSDCLFYTDYKHLVVSAIVKDLYELSGFDTTS